MKKRFGYALVLALLWNSFWGQPGSAQANEEPSSVPEEAAEVEANVDDDAELLEGRNQSDRTLPDAGRGFPHGHSLRQVARAGLLHGQLAGDELNHFGN